MYRLILPEKTGQKQWKDDKKDGDEPPPLPAPHAHNAWSPSDTKGTGSSHKGQQIGQWSVQSMKEALEEWEYWESRRVRKGLKRLEKFKAQITHEHGISPVTFGISLEVDLELNPTFPVGFLGDDVFFPALALDLVTVVPSDDSP